MGIVRVDQILPVSQARVVEKCRLAGIGELAPVGKKGGSSKDASSSFSKEARTGLGRRADSPRAVA